MWQRTYLGGFGQRQSFDHLLSSIAVESVVMSHPEVRKHPDETGLSSSISLRWGSFSVP